MQFSVASVVELTCFNVGISNTSISDSDDCNNTLIKPLHVLGSDDRYNKPVNKHCGMNYSYIYFFPFGDNKQCF